jgi:hypothetical protein
MDDIHVLIDAFVVAVPVVPRDRPDYIRMLVDWLRVLSRNRNRCSVSETMLAELWMCGRYPSRSSLERVLTELEIDDVSVVDVVNLLRPVSEREPFLEQLLGIRSIAAEGVAVEPAVLIERLPGGLGAALSEGVMMAMYAHSKGWAKDGLLLATAEVEQLDGGARGYVSLVERLDGTVEDCRHEVVERFELACDPAHVEADISIADVYADPQRAAVIAHAGVDPSRIGVGGHFVRSLETLNIHRQPAVLRAVYRRAALAALGQLHRVDGANVHPVRENANADSAQVTRGDGGKLWRCMVTKRGAGYRLHYWTLGETGIELERVLGEAGV